MNSNDLFAAAGFPLRHQGGNIYAFQATVGDRFILITEEEDGGYCVGLHSDVDCVTKLNIPNLGGDTVQTVIDFAQRLAVACFVRALVRSIAR